MPFFIDVFHGFYRTAIVPTFIDIVPFLINIVPTNNLFLWNKETAVFMFWRKAKLGPKRLCFFWKCIGSISLKIHMTGEDGKMIWIWNFFFKPPSIVSLWKWFWHSQMRPSITDKKKLWTHNKLAFLSLGMFFSVSYGIGWFPRQNHSLLEQTIDILIK